jgi:hypothetical protein
MLFLSDCQPINRSIDFFLILQSLSLDCEELNSKAVESFEFSLICIDFAISFNLKTPETFVQAAIKRRLRRMAHNKVHRQTGHKMIIDRNKILKYRDIKAIRRNAGSNVL